MVILLFFLVIIACLVLAFYIPHIGISLHWFAFDHRAPWEGFLICGGLFLLVPVITKLLLYPNQGSGFGPLGFDFAAMSLAFSSVVSVFGATLFLFVGLGSNFPLSFVLAPLGPVMVFAYAMLSEELAFGKGAKNKVRWRDFALLLVYLTLPIIPFNYTYMGILSWVPKIIDKFGMWLYALNASLYLFATIVWIAVARSKQTNFLPLWANNTMALQIGFYSLVQLCLVLNHLITDLQFGDFSAFWLGLLGALLILAVPLLCDLGLRRMAPQTTLQKNRN